MTLFERVRGWLPGCRHYWFRRRLVRVCRDGGRPPGNWLERVCVECGAFEVWYDDRWQDGERAWETEARRQEAAAAQWASVDRMAGYAGEVER